MSDDVTPIKLDEHDVPTLAEFEKFIESYLSSMYERKRDKALIDEETYQRIINVLVNPKDKEIDTRQFRFWAKNKFALEHVANQTPAPAKKEDFILIRIGNDKKTGTRVAKKHDIYNILLKAHLEGDHCARDKMIAIIKGYNYTHIPRLLIENFDKFCPTCKEKRNPQSQDTLASPGGTTTTVVATLVGDDTAQPQQLLGSPSSSTQSLNQQQQPRLPKQKQKSTKQKGKQAITGQSSSAVSKVSRKHKSQTLAPPTSDHSLPAPNSASTVPLPAIRSAVGGGAPPSNLVTATSSSSSAPSRPRSPVNLPSIPSWYTPSAIITSAKWYTTTNESSMRSTITTSN